MRLLAQGLLVVLICGCGSSDSGTKTPLPPSPAEDQKAETQETKSKTSEPKESKAASDAEVSDLVGRITLSGKIPPPRKLLINKDEEVCGAVDTVIDVVGSDGGVANVVIEIKGVEGTDWKWDEPADGYVIRQKQCQFLPGMVVIPNGKEISVYNDDPVGHNVNTGDWNQMQPPGKTPIVRPVEARAPIKIGCNIHSWMEAWIYPAQSPFYAVSDERGEFAIKGIPSGKYRVTIWHPFLGRKTERVTLDEGEVARLNHVFDSK